MSKNKIKLFDPSFDVREKNALFKAMESRYWASGSGEGLVKKFEKNFTDYIQTKSCVATNNGTSALHLALSLFNIKNREVILPSLSFVSTAHSVLYNGGKPVFVDVDPKTLCIDPKQIEEKINEKTIAILPVHFGGMPCDLDKIMKICKIHGINLIEDAAHAVGTTYRNKKIGTHGDAVCFSFHPVKNLAMPTGGAITINKNSKKYEKILKIKRWCGISNRKGSKYDVVELGWNFYMNEFSAAIGIEQLKKIPKMNGKRKNIAKRYHDEIKIPHKMMLNNDCSYHIFWLQVDKRDEFIKHMNKNGIETGIHYKPIHEMKFYSNQIELPNTESTGKRIISIPIHANMTQDDVEKVIKYCNNF